MRFRDVRGELYCKEYGGYVMEFIKFESARTKTVYETN